jgi:hypothetical protein
VSPKQRAAALFRARTPLLVTCGALGAWAATARGPAPGSSLAALARALGDAAGGASVSPDDVRWEPSTGIVDDATCGRRVVFLARGPHEDTRDVWRARARVAPEGAVVDVLDAHDLTSTPLGDDHELVVRGSNAAFATRAYGQEQSVTSLDLSGEGAQNTTRGLAGRAMAAITNLQQTGTTRGVARVDIVLDSPAAAAGLALDETGLAITLSDGDRRHGATSMRRARLDLGRGELVSTTPSTSATPATSAMHAYPSMHLPKRFSHWAVDTLRAVPWIGPAPIAWIEDQALDARDTYRRLAFKASGDAASGTLAVVAADPRPPPLDTSRASIEEGHWPPPRLPSMWRSAEAGEGDWAPPDLPWSRTMTGLGPDAPPAFYVTFVRPDEERPYVKVLLVAMDMRQLELDMEAGIEDPEPETGPHGPGRIPRDPAVYRRVAAAFNGAFKTEHGHYGMMVHKHVLLPPVPGAATVIVLDDGRVGLGSWGADHRIGGIAGVGDDAIVSYRQNLDPLIDRGQVNPTGRNLWGFTLPGKGAQTERSGLCVTTSGHLLYAWGEDVSATKLAGAMKMGGCDYAMHLDMNPYHTGFLFAAIDELPKKYRSQLLTTAMSIPTDRYIQYSPKDFFYVLAHEPAPPGVDGAGPWEPDSGLQPPPRWMPGLWHAAVETVETVEARADAHVDLLDVEQGRATWRIRAGTRESPAANPLRRLDGEEAGRVLVAVGAGIAPEGDPRGLATDGRLSVPAHGGADSGALVVSSAGDLAIVRAGDAEGVDAHADMLELPIALWDGKPATAGRAGPITERAAVGMTQSGRVVLARGSFASAAPLADALRRAGCTRALSLDRGARATGFLDRTGTPNPPRGQYDESVLYAIATPLKPRAFRFDPSTPVPPPK